MTPISKDAGDTAMVLALEKVDASKEAISKWIVDFTSKLPTGIKNIMLGRKGKPPFGFNEDVRHAVSQLSDEQKPPFQKITDEDYTLRSKEIDDVMVDVPAHLKRLDALQFPGEVLRMLNFQNDYGPFYKSLPLDVKLRGLSQDKSYAFSFLGLDRYLHLRLGQISKPDSNGIKHVEIDIDSISYKIPVRDTGIEVQNELTTKLEPGQTLVSSNCAGVVFKLLKKPGDRVEKYENIAIISAMKMEITVSSNTAGILEKYLVEECSSNTVLDGTVVKDGSDLCVITES